MRASRPVLLACCAAAAAAAAARGARAKAAARGDPVGAAAEAARQFASARPDQQKKVAREAVGRMLSSSEKEVVTQLSRLLDDRFGGDWRAAFDHYDSDRSGHLSRAEIKGTLYDADVRAPACHYGRYSVLRLPAAGCRVECRWLRTVCVRPPWRVQPPTTTPPHAGGELHHAGGVRLEDDGDARHLA
jgi:hypothetical protein